LSIPPVATPTSPAGGGGVPLTLADLEAGGGGVLLILADLEVGGGGVPLTLADLEADLRTRSEATGLVSGMRGARPPVLFLAVFFPVRAIGRPVKQ